MFDEPYLRERHFDKIDRDEHLRQSLMMNEINHLKSQVEKLRWAINERIEAITEYQSNPVVTSKRCGLADELLRRVWEETK